MTHDHIPPMFQVQSRVTALHALTAGYYHLTLHAPEIAHAAMPGQFVQVRPAAPGTLDPLLARPLSIFYTTPDDIAIIFKAVGQGTAKLARKAVGDAVTVLGPVGNGFIVPANAARVALVAGGVGMPPLYFLAETLRRTRPDCAITLFYGGRTVDDLLELTRWETLGVMLALATDDGSAGHHGLVTAPLQDMLNQQPFDFLAACGPRPMLHAVQQIAQAAGIPGQLSLEERMACGVGACLGCVCQTIYGRRRVCVDGPVFALDEVTFDA